MDHVLTLMSIDLCQWRSHIIICIDEDGSMICSWIDVKMTHYCLVMVVQMDELQSGPLMVKSLMGRCFAVNSKVVPLW
jgi:hypothetical protein